MTKHAALHAFFNSFGIPGYDETNVPADAALPYLTYTPLSSFWGDGEAAITVNLWYRGADNAAINAKADELAARLGPGGAVLSCDGGAIWLKRGAPFCVAAADTDPMIRRRYINITAEFLSA